jgi:opacity protein-like surface antigen
VIAARRFLAILSLILLTVSPGIAQDRAGLTVGATDSDLTGDDVVAATDARWGYHIGGFAETDVSESLSLNLGVNYTQKGGSGLLGTGLLDSERVELDLNYVELPLLVELKLPLGSTWSLMAYGGIGAAFNVSCKAALGGGEKEPCKDTGLGGPKTEWGVPAGGGLAYRLANGESIVLDVRYTWGLNDVVSNAVVRTGTWQFLVRLVGA